MVVTPDGKGLWIGSNRRPDRTRLVRLDVATGEETDVDSHPTFDIDPRAAVCPTLPVAADPEPAHRRLLGVRYLGERQVIHALDPHFADVLANLEKLSDGDLGRALVGRGGPTLGRQLHRRPRARSHLPLRPRAPVRAGSCSGRSRI